MKSAYSIALVIFLFSCDFGDTNVDPTALPDAPVTLLLPSAEAQTARNLASVGGRITGVVIQHFQGLDAQPLAYNTYLIDENALDDFWRTGLYVGAMKDCSIILEKGKTLNIPHYTGVARVLMAVNLGIATSFWGDVPYSQSFQGQELADIPYDAQEEVYNTIHELLDEAIIEFNLPAGDVALGSNDLIYSGNVALWKGTARALKARYYMHLSNKDSETATKALQALQGGTIFGNEVEPAFPFGETQNEANPIAYFGVERPNQLALNDYFVDFLNSRNDPRLHKYGELIGTDYLIYSRSGNPDLFWGQFSSPMPLISYSELLFIEAEAHLRLGNEESAEEKLQAAISANMQRLGIEDANIISYVNTYGDLDGLGSFDEKLERIIEQKYIAMFAQGTFEAWVDYRRTGYPQLTPPDNASESFNPSKVIPERYLYPFSERQTNTASVEAAIERQSGHLLDDALWAFN